MARCVSKSFPGGTARRNGGRHHPFRPGRIATLGSAPMQVLQPAEWSKPRGFSHGVVVDGPGKWVVLAGQTGGDEKGDYAEDMAAAVAGATERLVGVAAGAGARPGATGR